MSKQITNKKEFETHLDILRDEAQVLADKFQDIALANQIARVERWKQAGGCQKCRVRGQYVIWDTLDSLSGCYAQFEACKECAATHSQTAADARLVGACPDVVGKYDRIGQTAGKVKTAIEEWQTYEERVEQEEAAEKSGAAWKALENLRYQWEQHHSTDNGKEMVVTRGWKHIKRGMAGKVFWKRGERVGLRMGEEKDDKGFWKDTFFCQESQLGNPKPFMV